MNKNIKIELQNKHSDYSATEIIKKLDNNK